MKTTHIEMRQSRQDILDEILEAIDTKRKFFAIITEDGYCHISKSSYTGVFGIKLFIVDIDQELKKSDITEEWLDERIRDESYYHLIHLEWPI